MVPQSWSVGEDGKILAEITQVPLRLAWAITIHKSQGMSLDAAEIDLRNAFTYGQGYVAISRVRSFMGMKIIGINSQALLVDPRVIHRDAHFRQDSEDGDFAFSEMESEEVTTMQKNFISACGGKWREPGTVVEERVRAVKHESTYAQTKELILKDMPALEIARTRKMALSTIWSHIEKLAEDGEITHAHVVRLIPHDVPWNDVYTRIEKAIGKHGTEKLKPIYEELNEEYDYDLIRMGRIVYALAHAEENTEDVF